MATVDPRHNQVIQFVGQFRQVTAKHIDEVFFSDSLSIKPCYRVLDLLKERKFLYRLEHEHRLRGGAQGGSGPYIWVLGTEGYRALYGESSRPARVINYHTLEVTTTHVEMVKLQQAGKLQVVSYLTEPECHEVIGDV